ncbi:aspartate aminotransferase [Phaeodactylum tricornutum CCAP 1055/1]|uniref:Aspartate aminotransferase n=3 Tax=Phaeodactylum tricornutum TaxID=2850 RepID=B7GDE4_PHATC|nr:aspartate aminotransferase [Phaeodactylum tricornutum CCAP 1055/1]EEC43248.1 aspartate aminotransferase [Phaeodactylum tricornutum CCAP 1055/1]|eukprot:XP_002185116.1 aspartate aminotransferase [Phaeodactylum tricornutum CCAP 1055/1]
MLKQISQSFLRPTARCVSASSRVRFMSASPWADYEMAPFDPIIGLNEEYSKDDFPQKVIVGVGAYRDGNGKPYVLPCVREAEKKMMEQNLDMEYSGIAGDAKFVELALKFGYGKDSKPLGENRIQGVQALSGTGGLRVMGELLRKHGHTHIYVPNPTWGNHIPIFVNSGLEVRKYRYYDAKNSDLDFDGMITDIKEMPTGSTVLLHACAHNPTGMDPTLEQWKELSDIIKTKKLLPFFDCAYQGFASGDANIDAASVRMFVEDGHLLAMVQSFSKNFGLYGHRVGTLSVVGESEAEAKRVQSQLKTVIRPMYSNPPRHGARIVSTILSDPKLTQDFLIQCKEMADRIHTMRGLLRSNLEQAGSTHNWEHITRQIGMFAYSGLSKDQVLEMRHKHHVYCTADGRISMAGVTSGNVDYIAQAIHAVSK